jgi:hypothetical protein
VEALVKVKITSVVQSIDTGFQFRGRVEPHTRGNVAVLQVKDLKVGARFRATVLVSVRIDKDIEPYRVRPGNVLFLSRGHRLSAVAVEEDTDGDIIVPNYFYILRPKPSIVPAYLAWFINSAKSQEQLRLVHKGTHMPIVAKSDFMQLQIDLPSLDVQQRIVAVDGLARREQRLLLELLDTKKTLINQVCAQAASGRARKGK